MSETTLKANVLTDRLLCSWISCRRKAWLDKNGDPELRLWSPHRTLQLNHQQQSFFALMEEEPRRGVHAFENGASGIIGIRLKGKSKSGHFIESHPPLLQRIKGNSCWGDFSYRPVVSNQGYKVTRVHRLTLAFIGLLLENLQESSVSNGIAVSLRQNTLKIEKVSLRDNLNFQLNNSLSKLDSDLKLKAPPPITSDRRKCKLCSWRGICDQEANVEGYLSEVSGIGASREKILKEIGISNIKQLASSKTKDISQIIFGSGDKHNEIANAIISQARVQASGKSKRINQNNAIPELKLTQGVLIYDIESDSDEDEDFLHGFLKIEKNSEGKFDLEKSIYHPVLTFKEESEKIVWARLKAKLKKYSDWPVLHYGETELLAIRKLAKRQGLSTNEIERLTKRFIDIHSRVRNFWRLPTNSYSLKAVATWRGFRWKKIRVNGARALLWWRQWKTNKHKNKQTFNNLRWILEYNHDDCLATWRVVEWLLEEDKYSKD